MKTRLAALLLFLAPFALPLHGQEPAGPATIAPAHTILTPDEVAKLMPPTVFFQGQSAPIQMRNAAGARLAPKSLLLAALVDTSGYSSSIQARYQAYLITEQAISIDAHTLTPGAYGVGFLPADQFVVMDLGGHDLFLAHSTPDPAMRRPRPLQITTAPEANTFRLYEGRSFVVFTPSSSQ